MPYDTKRAGKRFLFYYQPKVGLILETELWFNLINQCRFHKIPLHLINARLSKNSLNKYLPFKEFINSGLSQLNSIFVRSKEDLDNFSSLTEANTEIMGNIKFEAAELMATDLRASVSLILAALTAKGKSVINRIYHLDRGYEDIEKKFKKVGAKIKRIN